MKKEVKNCQNCKLDFTIEPDDFSFYEKIKVPPPTFCPECRLQRRLAWMPSLALFKRKCDLCGEMGLSMYDPQAPFIIYCHKCWWSDKWNAEDYEMNIDFSKPFLAQWQELLQKTPILGLAIDITTGKLSPYTNHCSYAKYCYMIYYCDHNEDSAFGFELTNTKNVYNSGIIMETENCYDSLHVYKSYNIIHGTGNNRSCFDCSFIHDCEGCHDCFGLISAKNKSYVFLGEQLSKEEYKKKIKEINLGSHTQYVSWKNKALEYFKKNIPKPSWDTLSVDYSGSYVFHSKNCYECFDVIDCKDSKYLMLIKEGSVVDSYDYTDWGNNAELIYDSVVVGENASNVKFSQHCSTNIENIEYCKLQLGGSNCFGCVSLRMGQYSILNKKYSKEKYFEMVEKIKAHMSEMPYIDKKGNIYKYGEFFPTEFSPHAYNNSFASLFFPKNKEDVLKDKLSWHEIDIKEYPITISYLDLPDNIKETREEIINEIVGCSTCPRGYKIIKQELDLAKKLNVPLSRCCPFCRIEEKVEKWVSQMKQINRVCGKCRITFKTHYDDNEAPKIYCKKCYQQEVY